MPQGLEAVCYLVLLEHDFAFSNGSTDTIGWGMLKSLVPDACAGHVSHSIYLCPEEYLKKSGRTPPKIATTIRNKEQE